MKTPSPFLRRLSQHDQTFCFPIPSVTTLHPNESNRVEEYLVYDLSAQANDIGLVAPEFKSKL